MQKIMKPGHTLVHAETGKIVPIGTMLRAVEPVGQPHLWRLDAHHPGESERAHRVTVSRHHPKFGRVKRLFHPHVFGLVLVVKVAWHRLVTTKIHKAWHETWVGIYLGFLALIGLAFFEQYHMAPEITGTVMSIFGGGGSTGH